jgi:hypothetical protein
MKKLLLMMFVLPGFWVVHAPLAAEKEKPADPFDYNFCGGERVYPIVGVNISTACGPRNQIALGRRGKLMWYFPGDDKHQEYKGRMELSKEQLAQLSILAEVAKVTDNIEPIPGKLIYKMGINFSGRQPKYIYSNFDETYTPSNALLRQMMSLVPVIDKARFPECANQLVVFDPTLHQEDRQKKLQSQ